MVSSFRPAGRISISMSVTKPNSYSLLAILSNISLSFPIVYLKNIFASKGCKIVHLDGKTFAAATGTGGVGVVECQPFTIQSAGIIQFRPIEIKEAFHVYDNLDAVVFKHLVALFFHRIEIQFIF